MSDLKQVGRLGSARGDMGSHDFLRLGAPILASKLEPLGYSFEMLKQPSRLSGNLFAEGAFRREDREIRLWARFDRIGGVTYRVVGAEFDHDDYMRLLGRERFAEYSGWSAEADPFAGFRRIVGDFENCSEFLIGDAEAVLCSVRALPPEKPRRPRGI